MIESQVKIYLLVHKIVHYRQYLSIDRHIELAQNVSTLSDNRVTCNINKVLGSQWVFSLQFFGRNTRNIVIITPAVRSSTGLTLETHNW